MVLMVVIGRSMVVRVLLLMLLVLVGVVVRVLLMLLVLLVLLVLVIPRDPPASVVARRGQRRQRRQPSRSHPQRATEGAGTATADAATATSAPKAALEALQDVLLGDKRVQMTHNLDAQLPQARHALLPHVKAKSVPNDLGKLLDRPVHQCRQLHHLHLRLRASQSARALRSSHRARQGKLLVLPTHGQLQELCVQSPQLFIPSAQRPALFLQSRKGRRCMRVGMVVVRMSVAQRQRRVLGRKPSTSSHARSHRRGRGHPTPATTATARESF